MEYQEFSDVVDLLSEKIKDLINIKSLLKLSDVLIQHKRNGVEVTNGEDTELITIDEDYTDNENEIKFLCEVARTVNYQMGMDTSKHNEYRFECGLLPNGESSYMQIEKDLPGVDLEKIYDAGYEIIKRAH